MPYTNIPKPTTPTNYTNVNTAGFNTWSDPGVAWSDPNIYWSGSNPNMYTNIFKPVGTSYTNIPKPTTP